MPLLLLRLESPQPFAQSARVKKWGLKPLGGLSSKTPKGAMLFGWFYVTKKHQKTFLWVSWFSVKGDVPSSLQVHLLSLLSDYAQWWTKNVSYTVCLQFAVRVKWDDGHFFGELHSLVRNSMEFSWLVWWVLVPFGFHRFGQKHIASVWVPNGPH